MENPLQDITHLIRIKEKELHDVHDQRCHQLERLVSERDNLLIEASKRFEELRDDFQYNLTLLEARDHEIERLEGTLKQVTSELNDATAERRALRARIDVLEIKEAERFERHEEAKAANKRILQELRDVIEAMRWAAVEEARVKDREIEALKDDVQRANVSRDESLDTQRKDLTHTFEALLQQRETAFTNREKDIAAQVAALESKFQVLQTENARLKAETSDLHRRVEVLTDDVGAKEELARQLQWRLDDERAARQQADDSAQRRLHQAAVDLAVAREKAIQDVSEHQRAADKAASELQREKEFRAAAEARLNQQHAATQQEWVALGNEIAEARKAEALVRKENLTLKEERDKHMEARAVARAEADAAEFRCRAYAGDNEALKADVEGLHIRLREADTRLARLESELSEARQSAVAAVQEAERRSAQQAVSGDAHRAAEIAHARDAAAAEAAERHRATVAGYEGRVADLQRRVDDACARRDAAVTALREMEVKLDEERVEGNALRLRLQLMETQALELQQRLVHAADDRGRRDGRHRLGEGEGDGDDGPPRGHHGHMHGHGHDGVNGPPSPAFSEDYGPASLPDSPMMHPTPPPHLHHRPGQPQHPQTHTHTHTHRDGPARPSRGFDFRDVHAGHAPASLLSSADRSHEVGFGFAVGNGNNDGDGDGAGRDPLAEENERLKAVIKEMRADVEAMQEEMLAREDPTSGGGGGGGHGHGRDAAQDQLERRLEQTLREVARLRGERKRLMEVGNELRAALNRQHAPEAPSAPPATSSTAPAPVPPPPPPQPPSSSTTSHVSTHAAGPGGGRDPFHARPPVSYPPALRVTSHLGGPQRRVSPPRGGTHAPPPPPPSSQASQAGGQAQVEAIGAAVPVATSAGTAGALPIALTNSDRTTLSQMQARRRIIERQAAPAAGAAREPRRVYNYARGAGSDSHDEADP